MKIATLLLMALLGWFCPACTTSELDPAGNWDVLLTWTDGDCYFSGATSYVTTVSHGTTGPVIEGASGHAATGTVLCGMDQCTLAVSDAGPRTGRVAGTVDMMTVQGDLVMNAAEDIIGSGSATLRFADGTACQHAFLASGHRNLGVVSQ